MVRKILSNASSNGMLNDKEYDMKDKTVAPKPRGRKKKVVEEQTTYPIVIQGSHLTVTHYEDGTVDMVWDDDALARDVREAIASVERKEVV